MSGALGRVTVNISCSWFLIHTTGKSVYDSRMHDGNLSPGRVTKCCCQRVCMSVCLCVCLFVCPLAYLKKSRPNFVKFFCVLPVAAAWSFSDSNAICYVLPVE